VCINQLLVPGVEPSTLEYHLAMRDRMIEDALARVEGPFPVLASLIRACTATDPVRRCTAAQALNILNGLPWTPGAWQLAVCALSPYCLGERRAGRGRGRAEEGGGTKERSPATSTREGVHALHFCIAARLWYPYCDTLLGLHRSKAPDHFVGSLLRVAAGSDGLESTGPTFDLFGDVLPAIESCEGLTPAKQNSLAEVRTGHCPRPK
jgi:hypothetical protein